jgi:hypothetical protein
MISLRNWLIIFICMSAAVNVILLFKWNIKATLLNDAKYMLTDDEPLRKYLYPPSAKQSPYRRFIYCNSDELFVSTVELTKSLMKLDSLALQVTDNSSEGFFENRLAVSSEIQQDVWSAQQTYRDVLGRCILQQEQTVTKFYENARKTARVEYKKMTDTMGEATNGTSKTFNYTFSLIDTTISTVVTATKNNDSIRWNKRFKLIPHYLEKLDFFCESSRHQQLLHEIHKLEYVFSKTGFVTVYGKSYDLSNISPAEIRSVCKYVAFRRAEIDNSILTILYVYDEPQ